MHGMLYRPVPSGESFADMHGRLRSVSAVLADVFPVKGHVFPAKGQPLTLPEA